MSSDSTFVCGRCQRTLPGWMEADEGGICSECSENEQTVTWSTDTDDGEVTTTFESDSELSQSGAEPAESHDEETDSSTEHSTESEEASSETGRPTDPLDRKIDSWKEQLLDLTRRSNLVNFTVTKTKTLPFHAGEQPVSEEPVRVLAVELRSA